MIRLVDVAATVPAAPGEASPRTLLRSIDAAFAIGESHLLLGGNGSGKTTLLRLLAGLEAPSSGRVLRDGAAWEAGGDERTLWPDVAVLFEEPDPQFLGYSVESEVAFGLESLALPAEEIRSRTREALESFGLLSLAGRAPHSLSAGEKAKTLLAAALAGRPRLLLLDQALAHLDPGARRVLEERIVREALGGARAVVRSEQDARSPYPGETLHVLEGGTLASASALTPRAIEGPGRVPYPLALRVSALLARHGRWSGPLVADVESLLSRLEADRREPAQGRRSGDRGAAQEPAAAAPEGRARRPMLELEGVSWVPPGAGGAPVVSGVTLGVARGEVVALVGRSGSGKSTVLRLACGLLTPRSGVVRRDPPRVRRTRTVALALEYPERQLFGRTVLEDVAALLWVEGVPPDERARSARRALADVGLDPERFGQRYPVTLSEGEKRRTALAGVLVEPPQILLLDEPTAGLDPEGRRDLARVLAGLRERGRAVLLASHDLDFVSAVADRVVVLARTSRPPHEASPAPGGAAGLAVWEGSGGVIGEGRAAAVLRDVHLLERAGLPPPDFVRVEEALAAAGLLAATPVRDAETLLAALAGGSVRDTAPSV